MRARRHAISVSIIHGRMIACTLANAAAWTLLSSNAAARLSARDAIAIRRWASAAWRRLQRSRADTNRALCCAARVRCAVVNAGLHANTTLRCVSGDKNAIYNKL
jgi:hypothetical protein